MGLFGRNKYKKLKREDVVDAICQLSKQQEDMERGIVSKTEQIEELMEKGKREKNRDLKLFYAKKITNLQEEIKRDSRRCMFIMQNVKNMERLKMAIDDNQFIENTSKIPLNKLLSDQKGLSMFLEQALSSKSQAEESLVNTDQLFSNYENAVNERDEIYGVNESDDQLLAMFEEESQLDSESDSDVNASSKQTRAEQDV